MENRKRYEKCKAFTLVEILIVVIIIGILAGLMALSAGSSTETAERTACRGDRRTIKSAYYVERAENGSSFGVALERAMRQFTKGHALTSDDVMATYDGICHAGGVYIITESDEGDGKLGIMCTIQGHEGEDLYGWARLRVFADAINRILKLNGSAKQEALDRLLAGHVDIKGSANTNISNAMLAIMGSWPKWEKDDSLYVHPHFLNGKKGEVIYFANKTKDKVDGWNASAIYYQGQWYQKVNANGDVVSVVVAGVYDYDYAVDALRENIKLLKEDGSINTADGWQPVP